MTEKKFNRLLELIRESLDMIEAVDDRIPWIESYALRGALMDIGIKVK